MVALLVEPMFALVMSTECSFFFYDQIRIDGHQRIHIYRVAGSMKSFRRFYVRSNEIDHRFYYSTNSRLYSIEPR